MSDYRYTLTRCWKEPTMFDQEMVAPRTLVWVMLNPSTADEVDDDPTIRRCVRFSKDAGYEALIVVNLFAARATNPKDLCDMAEHGIDPIGADNPYWLSWAAAQAEAVVFAWGAWPCGPGRRLKRLWPHTIIAEPLCLGHTASGEPKHPLYVRADQPLIPFIRRVSPSPKEGT